MRLYLALGPLLLAVTWSGAAKAHGAFLVNTTADVNDGACEAPPTGDCSLREAILGANALVNDHPDAPDTIAFDFSLESMAPFNIVLDSPLPPITEGVILNGSSEPRYIIAREHRPVILVDGGGFDHVLEVRSDSTLVIAIAFTNAAVSAIDAELSDFLLIQGCYFGIEPSTGAALQSSLGGAAFGSHAIHVRDTLRARIGGQGELARNIIAGAGAQAVLAERADGLLLHENYVGVDPAGLEARPNGLVDPSTFSIDLRASESIQIWENVVSANLGGAIQLTDVPGAAIEGNLIGLDATGRAGLGNASTGLVVAGDLRELVLVDNVISANEGPGVLCAEDSMGPWRMQRNLVGVDIAQSDILPNLGHGVSIESGCEGATIGSVFPDEGNLVVHNQGAGVRSVDGQATILGNAMFLNGGLAIDAGPPGRTANDPTASTLPINHPDGLELSLEDDAVVLRACVAPGSRVEVFEALVESDGTAGPFRFLTHGVEGGAEDTDTSTACSEFNDAAFELSLPIEASIGALVLTATEYGQTSELSDPVALIDDAVPSQDCSGYADCGPERPICDLVFRRCVLCLDDAVDDEIDTGCSTQTPRCNGELSGRSCEPASLSTPRELPNPDPSTGCSLTPQDENPTKSLLWCLIGFAVLRKKRFKARSIT